MRRTALDCLADLEEDREIDGFGAELADRFGPLPEEVKHLLKIVAIKAMCRRANVEKIDGVRRVWCCRSATTSSPKLEGLVAFIREEGPGARVRPDIPDMKIVFFEDWPRSEQRLQGTTFILRTLVAIAERKKAA
jgi:transcription-repair coupling factor (superfamily II helicase)